MTNAGGRYNLATDAWISTSIPAEAGVPAARRGTTAIWTGNEMILWGGQFLGFFSTGSRYQPSTDTWTSVSNTDAPDPRSQLTAIWAGSEMIVWGGYNNDFYNTGGRYNPVQDKWESTTTVDAPIPRSNHVAVWTGTEMIVWGGFTSSGGRYCALTPITCSPSSLPFLLRLSQCKIAAFDSPTHPITLSCTGLPNGATCNFSNNPVTPSPDHPATINLTVQLSGSITKGLYPFQLVGTTGTITYTYDMELEILQ